MLEWGVLLVLAGAGAPGLPTPQVQPAGGDAYQAVTLSVAVPDGTTAVTFRDGDRVIAAQVPASGGTAHVTTNGLGGGEHRITAAAEAGGTDAAAWSAAAAVTYGTPAPVGNVVVVIPAGSLTVTAAAPGISHSPAALVPSRVERGVVQLGGITVTDTRAGNLGFTVSATVLAPGRADRIGRVAAVQVPNNAMLAGDVRTPSRPSSGPSSVIASYPAGLSTGSVGLRGLPVTTHSPSGSLTGPHAADPAQQRALRPSSATVRVLVTAW